jgi:RNA polymerase sigma-70 factor (ECF subfamily)
VNVLTDILTENIGQSREARFTEFVERQSRFVFKVAWAILRNAEDAEDIVQETFLKLYRTRSWEGIRDERAFLARAAWRLAVDQARSRGRTQSRPPEPESAEPSITPEQALIAGNWTAAVYRLMDALPEELRQPLALSAIEELTSPEIAAILGIREGTVRTRIMRARQILKQKLASLTDIRHGQ